MPLRLFSSVGLQIPDWWEYFVANVIPIYAGKKNTELMNYKM